MSTDLYGVNNVGSGTGVGEPGTGGSEQTEKCTPSAFESEDSAFGQARADHFNRQEGSNPCRIQADEVDSYEDGPDKEGDYHEEYSEDRSYELYKRAAWTYGTIHRLLSRHGRTREALEQRYYLPERRARIRQVEAEGPSLWSSLKLLQLLLGYVLILISERLRSVIITILFVTVGFSVVYWGVGGVSLKTGEKVGPVRLFLFSLVTLFEGTYSIINEAVPFGIVEELDPLFGLGLQIFGVKGMNPATTTGTQVAALEHSVGVLLIIPFSLLFVQRLRLYARSAANEGTGGLTLWLFGK